MTVPQVKEYEEGGFKLSEINAMYDAAQAKRKTPKHGKGQRQRGDRFERECVKKLDELGVRAVRVPLSGSVGGDFSGDLRVDVCGETKNIECKIRKRAWSDLYAWLPGHSALFIRTDNKPALVVMTLEEYAFLAQGFH